MQSNTIIQFGFFPRRRNCSPIFSSRILLPDVFHKSENHLIWAGKQIFKNSLWSGKNRINVKVIGRLMHNCCPTKTIQQREVYIKTSQQIMRSEPPQKSGARNKKCSIYAFLMDGKWDNNSSNTPNIFYAGALCSDESAYTQSNDDDLP